MGFILIKIWGKLKNLEGLIKKWREGMEWKKRGG
jgi:hypothetical protein